MTCLFPIFIQELDTLIFNKLDDQSLKLLCSVCLIIRNYCQPTWQFKYKEIFTHLYKEHSLPEGYTWETWYFYTRKYHDKCYCVITSETEASFGGVIWQEYSKCRGICDNINDAYNIFVKCIVQNVNYLSVEKIDDLTDFINTYGYNKIDCYIRSVKLPYIEEKPFIDDNDIIGFYGDPWTIWTHKKGKADLRRDIKFADNCALHYRLDIAELPTFVINSDFLVQNAEYCSAHNDYY